MEDVQRFVGAFGSCAWLHLGKGRAGGPARQGCPLASRSCLTSRRPHRRRCCPSAPADYARSKPHVYFVTVRQLLGWMRAPVPVGQLTAARLGCGLPGGAPGPAGAPAAASAAAARPKPPVIPVAPKPVAPVQQPVQQAAKPVATQPAKQPAVQPTVQPSKQPVKQPAAQPAVQPAAETNAQPAAAVAAEAGAAPPPSPQPAAAATNTTANATVPAEQHAMPSSGVRLNMTLAGGFQLSPQHSWLLHALLAGLAWVH